MEPDSKGTVTEHRNEGPAPAGRRSGLQGTLRIQKRRGRAVSAALGLH